MTFNNLVKMRKGGTKCKVQMQTSKVEKILFFFDKELW